MRLSILISLLSCGTLFGNVLNFAGLSQAGTSLTTEGATVTQSGFTLTSGSNLFGVWDASSPNLPGLTATDTSLFEYFAFSTTTLTGPGPFSLSSIDLAPLLAGGSGSFSVLFTGTLTNSSIVTQTFTVNDGTPPALQTFSFSNFNNLTKVQFTQGTNIGFFATQDTAYQFDNLNVTLSSTPEPTSVVFLGSAVLIGTAALRRKRQL